MCTMNFQAGPILALSLALALAPATAAAALPPNAITGVWLTPSGGYVQIFKNSDAYIGVAVGSVSGEPRFDTNNPDPDERGRRLLGAPVLWGLEYDSGNDYGDGRVYQPSSGKTYDLAAELTNCSTLEVTGYIGITLFGKSQTWQRVSPNRSNIDEAVLRQSIAPPPECRVDRASSAR